MKTQRISKRQALLVAITTIIGAVLQPVFRGFMLSAGNGAWVPIILATVFSVTIFLLVLRLAKRFPNQSAANYLPLIWGRAVGYLLALLLLLGLFLKATFILRHVSEFFVAAVLPETPISAVMIVLLVLILAGVLSELEGIVRFNELVLPLIVFSLALVFVSSIPAFSGWELLPLFDKGFSGLWPVFLKASGYFANMILILFIYPLIVDKDQFTGAAAKTLCIAGGILLAIYLNVTLTLGSSLGQVLTWPYLTVVENIPVGVERSEAVFMVIWLLAAFASISLFVYIFALGLNQLFPRLKQQWIGLFSILVMGYLALLPDNLPSAVIDHVLINRYTLYLFTAVPLLSLALAAIRNLKDEQLEQ